MVYHPPPRAPTPVPLVTWVTWIARAAFGFLMLYIALSIMLVM